MKRDCEGVRWPADCEGVLLDSGGGGRTESYRYGDDSAGAVRVPCPFCSPFVSLRLSLRTSTRKWGFPDRKSSDWRLSCLGRPLYRGEE